MCAVVIKFKNIKKCCVFFVVPGNGQALIGMPDTTSLNIVKVNIDFIQTEIAECKTSNKQEMQSGMKDYSNMDIDTINNGHQWSNKPKLSKQAN